MFGNSWNAHTILGKRCDIPNYLAQYLCRLGHISPSHIPTSESAVYQYKSSSGCLSHNFIYAWAGSISNLQVHKRDFSMPFPSMRKCYTDRAVCLEMLSFFSLN